MVEAYVFDTVVKTRRSESLVRDLRETFDKLKANDIELNPKKCLRRSRRHATRFLHL